MQGLVATKPRSSLEAVLNFASPVDSLRGGVFRSTSASGAIYIHPIHRGVVAMDEVRGTRLGLRDSDG